MVNPYKSRGRYKSLFRRFFVIVMVLGGSPLLLGDVYRVLASSSSSSEVSSSVGPHAVETAKSYKIARDLSAITSLDPTHYYRVPREPILDLLYGSLRDFLADYFVEEGGKRHVLTLKPDLKFASGNPITAQDLAFTIKRAIRLSQLPRDHYVQFDLLPQNVEEKIKILSPTQVQIEVGGDMHPDIFKAILFDGPAGCLLDKQLAEEKEKYAMTPTWLQRNSAGAGPYQLEKFDKGTKVVLRRNPYYKSSLPGQGLSEQGLSEQEAGRAKVSKLKAGAAAQAEVLGYGDPSSSAGAAANGAVAASKWPLQSWPKKVIFRHFPSIKGREKALQRGWVDQAYQVRPPKGVAQGASDIKEGEPVVYRWENTYTLTLLLLNHSKPILANPWVRKAISQAIPYDTLMHQFKIPGAFTHRSFLPLGVRLEGQDLRHEPFMEADQRAQKGKKRGVVVDPSKDRALAQEQEYNSSFASSFNISSYPDARPSLKDSRYNLDAARRDLTKADLATHQRPLSLTLLATDEQLAKHLQRQLKKIGIQLSLDLVEEEAFFAKLTQHNFDLALMNWGLEYFHPHANAYACLYNASQEALFTLASFAQWESDAISRDVLSASKHVHTKDRINIYKDIEKRFLEEAPIIVLFQQGIYKGVRQETSPPRV